MNELQKRIIELKHEKNALILAHYYQSLDIQAVADHVCDSFELAKRAGASEEKLLVMCGVRFMAESAKILSPEKTVLLPVPDAGCPMADMIKPEDVRRLKHEYPDAAVVCYVNSSAAVKAESDICCTSSSAEKIVRSLPNKKIIFIPDCNLGAYIASKVPEKEIILYEGHCPIHNTVREKDVLAAKKAHPNAQVLAHPECRPEVLKYADYIGSTSGILEAAEKSHAHEFIIGTEVTIAEKLSAQFSEKKFYPMTGEFLCPDMKKISLPNLLSSLENMEHEIILDKDEMDKARSSLEKMVNI
ncbi:MAG: quinolinate synthase NadA [Clostridiales bacterium]|nr:quinolinate synthase NadA [Clostridiales bacterium]